MKKLNRKLIKGTNRALAGLLTYIGFSSCWPFAGVYGTEQAEYIVSGKVTDMEGESLQGIRVSAARADFHGYRVSVWELKDTLYTDDRGVFIYPFKGSSSSDQGELRIKFDDVKNIFASDSTVVAFSDSDLEGMEKNIKISLKEKDSE